MKPLRIVLVVSSILATSLLGIAQATTPTPGRSTIGICLTPGIGYRTLVAADDNSTTQAIIGLRNDLEEPRFTHSAALMFAYHPWSCLGFEAGIGYTVLGYQMRVNGDELTFGDQIDPRRGFVYDSADGMIPEQITYRDNFQYLTVPIRAVTSVGNGPWRWISGLGVTTGFLLNANTTIVRENADGTIDRSTEDAVDDFNPVTFSPMVSTGVAWSLSDRLELRAEPVFSYGISRVIGAPVTGHLWNAGIGVGLMMRL